MIIEKEQLDWDYIIKVVYEEKMRASLYFILYQTQLVLGKDLKTYLERLRIPLWQKTLIVTVVNKYAYASFSEEELYPSYLLCHLLLYDTIGYPIRYLINIPQEQFAKFYRLPLYNTQTTHLYRLRYIYIPYKLFVGVLSRGLSKMRRVN